MIEITTRRLLKKHSVKVYDDVQQLPITRFNKLQKYQMIASGIGTNLGDFDSHLENLITFVNTDSKGKAASEIANMRHLFWHMINEINPDSLAFACLVHSINGEELDDHSDAGIEATSKKLELIGITKKLLDEKRHEVKKKLRTN